MPSQDSQDSEAQVKTLLLDSIKQKVYNQTLSFIASTRRPLDPYYDVIAVRNICHMLVPKTYEDFVEDWRWATGDEIPVSLEEALNHMESFLMQKD